MIDVNLVVIFVWKFSPPPPPILRSVEKTSNMAIGVGFYVILGHNFTKNHYFWANYWNIARIHNYTCYLKILEKSPGPILRSVEKTSNMVIIDVSFWVILAHNFVKNHFWG